jgi:hypothetical protein
MTLVDAIAKLSIELIAIYFHSFEIFIIPIGELYYYQVKLFSGCSKSIGTSARTSISRISASKWPATAQ